MPRYTTPELIAELRRQAAKKKNATWPCVLLKDLLPLCDEYERLRDAAQQTLDENMHLADGDVCTLLCLKRALQPNARGKRRHPRSG